MLKSVAHIFKVRNRYETEIGHFQPPQGGAEFIDPKAFLQLICSVNIFLPGVSDVGFRFEIATSYQSGLACRRRRTSDTIEVAAADGSPCFDPQGEAKGQKSDDVLWLALLKAVNRDPKLKQMQHVRVRQC